MNDDEVLQRGGTTFRSAAKYDKYLARAGKGWASAGGQYRPLGAPCVDLRVYPSAGGGCRMVEEEEEREEVAAEREEEAAEREEEGDREEDDAGGADVLRRWAAAAAAAAAGGDKDDGGKELWKRVRESEARRRRMKGR